jgi:hypothetical protein
VEFVCGEVKHLSCPADLVGRRFKLSQGEFSDDVFAISGCAQKLSKALSRLRKVTGGIGLDISLDKTEWLYLHNPDNEELEHCRSERKTSSGHCGNKVVLDGE